MTGKDNVGWKLSCFEFCFRYIYISPNLANSSHSIVYEQQFMDKMRTILAPAPVDFLGEIPALDDILGYLPSETSKVLFILGRVVSVVFYEFF